jgi:hypothetical protein
MILPIHDSVFFASGLGPVCIRKTLSSNPPSTIHHELWLRSIALNRAQSRSIAVTKGFKKMSPHENCPCNPPSTIHYQLSSRTGLTGLTGWDFALRTSHLSPRTSDPPRPSHLGLLTSHLQMISCLDRLTSRRIFGLAEVENEQVT